MKKQLLVRAVIGGCSAALLIPLLIFWIHSMALSPDAGHGALPVSPAFLQAMGGRLPPALTAELLLSFAFGASVGLATLPFADDRPALLRDSLLHFAASGALFFLLCAFCRLGTGLPSFLFLLGLFCILYVLIWLARWMRWYADVLTIRAKLGLTAGISPLHWRQTMVYLPLLLLLCDVLPCLSRCIDHFSGADVPAFSALVLPFLLLPTGAFCCGLSLGRWAGFCPLLPLLAGVLYLPMVYVLFNATALFHTVIVLAAALLGNLLGTALHHLAARKERLNAEHPPTSRT